MMFNTLFYPHIFGGAERSVQLLAEGLTERGHEVTVVSVAAQQQVRNIGTIKAYYLAPHNTYWGGMPRKVNRVKKLAWHLGDIFNPGIYRDIAGILEEQQPDIIHTHMMTGLSAAPWMAARRQGIPLVHTLREYSLICESSTMFRNNLNCGNQCLSCRCFTGLKKYLSNHGCVNHLVGLSDFIIQRHQQHGYFQGVPCSRVFNGVPTPYLRPSITRSSRLSVKILYLGRIDRAKGVFEVLEAVQQVKGIELYLGGLVLDNTIQEKIDNHGYPPNIKFLGFINPEDLLGEIDAVIVPSRWHEPFGRVVIEAYQYGKPVIASDRGGLPEIVIEGKTGFLYDPDQPSGLVEILRRLIEQPGLLAPMAGPIEEHLKIFDNRLISGEYESIYQSVLQGANP